MVREASVSDVRFCFRFCVCFLVHVSWLSVSVPSLSFLLDCLSLVFPSLSLLVATSPFKNIVRSTRVLHVYSCFACFYSLAVVSALSPLSNVWLFDIFSVIHSV